MKQYGMMLMVLGGCLIVYKLGWIPYFGVSLFVLGDRIYDFKLGRAKR